MHTTPEFWEVDGYSLQTLAYNITTWGGDRQSPPPLRGDNVPVPHAVGSKWMPKIPDSNTITLAMWVIGAEEDGSVPRTGSRADTFRENWKMLRNLLWTPYREVTLTKRIRHPVSGLWVPVTAKAQYAGGLIPSMLGGSAAVFTVDLHLADPFFYGDEEVIEFTDAEDTQEFVTLGDSRTNNITILFNGQCTGPRITDANAGGLWTRYTPSIQQGAHVNLDVKNFKATYYPDTGSSYRVAGNVDNAGDHYWLYLDPGPTDLVFSTISGSGSATLSYLPRWL